MTVTDPRDRSEAARAAGCPVIEWDIMRERPALGYFASLDELREQTPVAWNTFGGGFWMLNRNALVREAYQTPDVFSNSSITVTVPDPDFMWIPSMTDEPIHRLYRQVLNPSFSPKAIAAMEEGVRRDCAAIIESLRERGSADLVADFAMVYPTQVFLQLVQLPQSDTATFVGWVEDIFGGLGNPDGDQTAVAAAFAGIDAYFTELLAARRAEPQDDFFGTLAKASIGDRPIRDDEFLNIALVLILGGLDTVKSQLGYMFFHLARHPEDRARLVADPDVAPAAVEELLRAFAIVMDGRKVTRDVDFHGCPMKAGDMVMLTLPAASRDTTQFADAERIDFDREAVTHFSFGSGPHRCLGSHLARLELKVALQEWHRLIPDYGLDPAVDLASITESGPQLGLTALPLVWPVRG